MGLTNNLGKLSNMITSTGSAVGIAQPSPSYTLDVSGTLRNTGNAILASTSGLVGIGQTAPSLIDTGFGTLELNGTSGSGIKLDVNGGTTGYIYSASGLMNIYYTTGYFSISSSGNTERMRITSAGNVGIGTSSPASRLDVIDNRSNYGVLKIENDSTSGYSSIEVFNSSGSQVGAMGYANASAAVTPGNMYMYSSGNITFLAGGTTERMRLSSIGNLLVNRTAESGQNAKIQMNTNGSDGFYVQQQSAGGYCYVGVATSNGGTFFFNTFQAGSTQVGQITSNGSTTTYATSSDYRIKEDLKETKGLEKVSAIKIYDFKYKDTENRMDGVIAHELQDIIPYAVVGEKDGENMQGVDYSLIVPVLVKAIQELSKQNEELSNRLNKAGL